MGQQIQMMNPKIIKKIASVWEVGGGGGNDFKINMPLELG